MTKQESGGIVIKLLTVAWKVVDKAIIIYTDATHAGTKPAWRRQPICA